MRDFYFLDTLGESLLRVLEANAYKYPYITYDEKKYTLRLEMPGVKEKDLTLSFSYESLKIKLADGGSKNLYIGDNVDEDNIAATLEDGILTVTFPKKSSAVKTIKISKP